MSKNVFEFYFETGMVFLGPFSSVFNVYIFRGGEWSFKNSGCR